MLKSIRSSALALGRPIHVLLRGRKLKLFKALLPRCATDCTLLDVGGGTGIAGEFCQLYSFFGQVTVVNIRIPPVSTDLVRGLVRRVIADGCGLPFESCAFDWVFSNAVIEHVGPWERQKSFADEIRRVARRGYFVATPNKYFPVEPHTYLPFYQFLSSNWQRRVVRFSPGYMREYEDINLLSRRDLRVLFPGARVIDSGFPLFGNSLVAYYKR